MTHHRQHQIEAAHAGDPAWKRTARGPHRCRGWCAAISEARPKYLGADFPESSWPTGPRPKKGSHTLSEVEACHWPFSFRPLLRRGDLRLPCCTQVDVQAKPLVSPGSGFNLVVSI
jgi:hypothetical protein